MTYTDGSAFTTSDLTGPTGAAGNTGAAGADGAQGIQGIQGETGAAGTNGSDGTNGTNGSDGNGISSTADNGNGTFTLTYTDGSAFTTSDLTGPPGAAGTDGVDGGPINSGSSGKIYRNTGGADRGSTSNVFGAQGDWSSDFTISEKSSAQALGMGWEGTSHNGMGATGWASFTGGAYNRASGVGSVAFGFHNVAGPTSSEINTIDGNHIGQTAFGYGTLASGNASFTSGQGTEASGSFSTSVGYYTTASDYSSFVIGSWNLSGSTVTSQTAFSASAPAFVVGNGTGNNSRSDAFKVLFDGTTTASSSITASAFIGDGSQLTNLPSTVNEVADEFTASSGQTSFTLTQTPSSLSKIKMYINGIRISNTAYSWTGTTLTYTPANNGNYSLSANDRVQMDYTY